MRSGNATREARRRWEIKAAGERAVDTVMTKGPFFIEMNVLHKLGNQQTVQIVTVMKGRGNVGFESARGIYRVQGTDDLL